MRKLIIMLLCAAPSMAAAEQWQILGTRPMGMGGAFVAVAQGPIAQYWNPAGLVKSSANVSGMDIPVGVTAEFTGNIVENASEIGDMAEVFASVQADQRGGTAMDANQVAAFAKTLSLMGDMNEPGKGALFDVAGGVNFKFSKVALSVNNFTSIGLNPFIDTTNVGFGAVAGYGGSGIDMSGVTATTAGMDADQIAASNNIEGAINTISYAAIENLICGSGGCLSAQTAGAITNADTLANAFVQQAMSSGLTNTEITNAGVTLVQYAADVAPVIAGASAGASYSENTSALNVAGASFTEIAAGYAWNLDKWMHGLSLGANLKLINGRTAATTFRFLSESDTADAFTLEDTKASWQPAADLGLLWNVKQTYAGAPFSPRVGLVMRNINSPSFKMPAGGDYDLDRQVRLGFALNPTRFWTLAADMDLTKNSTPVDGFDSRQLALGTEINVFNRKAFNIPLRAGIMKNLAEKDSKMAYTLGTGINLLYMHLDVSGVVSSERTTLDDKDIPTKVGVAASFGLLF